MVAPPALPLTISPPAPPALPALPPLSLYVHFPWCVRKCPYCDFNSHALRGALPEAEYIDALLRDLDAEVSGAQARPTGSIFLGGGTPSLFSPQALARLLEGCRGRLVLADDVEITLEANPGTVERGRFAEYRAAGITRVSLGAQSFSDAHLRVLGRIHAASDTQRAAEELHAAGLTNFNLDLMYALPQQSIEQACADVRAALALAPAHVSHYQLTLEPGTAFGARPPPGLPDMDSGADMQRSCQQQLAAAGLLQYEVSGYARPGAQCRHNLNYWRFGDYLGIGAGAHGKCTRIDHGQVLIERSERPREPRRYLSGERGERHLVAAADLPFEFLMNTLRLREGFLEEAFEARTGLAFGQLAAPLARLRDRGLMERDGEHWRASRRGFDFLNDLLAEFLPEAPIGAMP
jgi:oxygen-independent coproporphyrinogen-3 oxidase